MGEPYNKKEWETILETARKKDRRKVVMLYDMVVTSEITSEQYMERVREIAERG